jgi:predicted DNA-binding protein
MSLVQKSPVQAKPVGSLSSSMLARKGDARPGQRYMPEPGLEIPERSRLIKFGSDMLSSLPPVQDISVHQVDVFEPFTDAHEFVGYDSLPDEAQIEAVVPDVHANAKPMIVPIVALEIPDAEPDSEIEQEWKPPVKMVLKGTRKSAFTLRLDAERHLRLRLLSAHQHRSAQQIVIEAVDRFLADVFDPLMASGRLSRDG